MRSITIYFDDANTSGINISAPEHLPPGSSTDEKPAACGLGFKDTAVNRGKPVLFVLDAEAARTIGEKLIAFAAEKTS